MSPVGCNPHRHDRHTSRRGDLAARPPFPKSETQNFSDLAHVAAGSGHRVASNSREQFEAGLTPTLRQVVDPNPGTPSSQPGNQPAALLTSRQHYKPPRHGVRNTGIAVRKRSE